MSGEDFAGLATSMALARAEAAKPWQYLVAALHWACLKNGLRVAQQPQPQQQPPQEPGAATPTPTPARAQSDELMPDKWSERELVQVQYQDRDGRQYEARARLADARTDAVLLEMLRKEDLEMVSVLLDVDAEVDDETDPRRVLRKPEELVRKFKTRLFEPIFVKPEPVPVPVPKADAARPEADREQARRDPLLAVGEGVGPRRAPPGHGRGGYGVGEEDLFPYGLPPPGRGGMLFDPLNFFQGQGRRDVPRYDPLVPLPFGRGPVMPDRDHFRPPGGGNFDDMFM